MLSMAQSWVKFFLITPKQFSKLLKNAFIIRLDYTVGVGHNRRKFHVSLFHTNAHAVLRVIIVHIFVIFN